MAKITRIKATDPGKSPESPEKAEKTARRVKVGQDSHSVKKPLKTAEKAAKKATTEKSTEKKPFILIRPLVYLGRYIRDSWKELRLVRWPTRKATWKLVLAIFIYTALFIAIIMLLDALFTWLFNIVIG